MDFRHAGFGEFESQDEDQRHSHFGQHRPPPPPPNPEHECGERFGGRRVDDDEGFPRYSGRRGDDDEGCRGRGGRRVEDEEGFQRHGGMGRDDEEGQHPPRMEGEERYHSEPPPPQLGHMSHGGHIPGGPPFHHDGPGDEYGGAKSNPRHDECAPTDLYTRHSRPQHTLTSSDSHHSQGPLSDADRPSSFVEGALSEQTANVQLDSSDIPQGRLVRIFCKENSGFNLAVERNSLGMQQSNTEDEAQQWIKDASHGMRVKDSFGYPAFSLINKKTRKMLKHANEEGLQVLLVDYQADLKDEGILWTESQDFGEGFKTVRSASNTLLNLTVFEGNKRIRNGSALVLDTWHKGDHQLWKLFPL